MYNSDIIIYVCTIIIEFGSSTLLTILFKYTIISIVNSI